MVSPMSEVVVLCSSKPSTSHRRVQKIAELLGAEATFVSLSEAALGGRASIMK